MEQIGVALVADGADRYLNTLTQVAAAETKLASAADPAVAAINALDDKAGAAGAAAKSMSMYIDAASGEMRIFESDADKAANEAAGLGKAADKAGNGIDDLGDAAKKGGKSSTQLGDDAEKGARGVSLLDKIATGAAEKIGHLMVNAAQDAGRAVLRFIGDSINAAGDFESGMNRFASVTGDALSESGQSLNDFKELFISLGRELPVSTADVQQAAIEMAKGGIEPATIAAGGLRDVLDLAAAGEVGIAEAAEIASKQLGVWVDSAADAQTKAAFLKDSVNLLSQAANASTVDVDSLALGLANTGKSADLAGLSFRETVTSMALISSGFSSAADAGTSFKTFLARLQPTTDSQADAFKRLNLLTADGTSKFYDAQGSFIGMDKAAQLLQDSLKDLSPAQKEMALNAAFGSDAIRAAGMLADAGADGYKHMAEEMAKAGSAAAQAAKKQQGFNVAVDNIQGSLEAFQITVAGAVLPMLTRLINFLASGINAITDYADATIKGETALASIASVISEAAMPALIGLTAATTAWAYVQVATGVPATVALIAKVALATEAFFANAAAVAAAMAPYAVMAAAVAAMAWAYQDFTNKVQSAAQELLNSKPWWEASTVAVEDYATQTGEAKKALEPYAATIQVLRDQIQGEVEDLGKRMAAGMLSEEQYTAELAVIQSHRDGLVEVTNAYNEVSQALIKQTAESMTATSQAASLQTAEADLGSQASLTAKDIEDLGKKIDKTFQEGQEAVQAYATSYSEFATGMEQRADEHADKIAELEAKKQKATTKEQKQGIDDQIDQVNQAYADQEQSAALSYARQQEAQKQHLGQMLIDYTVAQAQLGNISKDKAAEITSALETEYGLQESSTATTFLHMASSIDQFARDAGGDIDHLIGDLRDQGQQAEETQKKMDDYAKEYVATQVNNFLEGKQDAESYVESLEKIPKDVTTTVTTRYVQEGDHETDAQGHSGSRAVGGPITAGRAYLVGEKGPELVIPDSDGTVLTASQTRRAMASGAQLGGMMGGGSSSRETNLYLTLNGAGMMRSDVIEAVRVGMNAAGQSADLQIRVGG